jgi:hypothetical protein
MSEAEHAVRKTAAAMPAEIRARFDTAKTLSPEDRESILALIRPVLAPFQPKTPPKREAEEAPKLSKTESKPGAGDTPKLPKTEPRSVANVAGAEKS